MYKREYNFKIIVLQFGLSIVFNHIYIYIYEHHGIYLIPWHSSLPECVDCLDICELLGLPLLSTAISMGAVFLGWKYFSCACPLVWIVLIITIMTVCICYKNVMKKVILSQVNKIKIVYRVTIQKLIIKIKYIKKSIFHFSAECMQIPD